MVEDLREETSALTEQLERLRALHGTELIVAKERAITERRKRLRAEQDCSALRQAVYTQRRFIHGLRSVFSATPRAALVSVGGVCTMASSTVSLVLCMPFPGTGSESLLAPPYATRARSPCAVGRV
jgi:hypothetical protein